MQGSPAWHAARRGRITASEAKNLLTAKKAEPSVKARTSYIARLIADVSNLSPNWFSEDYIRNKPPNPAMIEGTRREPESRRWLAHEMECNIQTCGMIVHDNNLWSWSPDGLLIDENGEIFAGAEIKNPEQHTQVARLVRGTLPPEAKQQCHAAMIVSGLPRVVFASYAPPLPGLKIVVERDAYTTQLEDAYVEFTGLYNDALKKVLGYDLQTMLARLHATDAYADVA